PMKCRRNTRRDAAGKVGGLWSEPFTTRSMNDVGLRGAGPPNLAAGAAAARLNSLLKRNSTVPPALSWAVVQARLPFWLSVRKSKKNNSCQAPFAARSFSVKATVSPDVEPILQVSAAVRNVWVTST